jgi:hypothetical protein
VGGPRQGGAADGDNGDGGEQQPPPPPPPYFRPHFSDDSGFGADILALVRFPVEIVE